MPEENRSLQLQPGAPGHESEPDEPSAPAVPVNEPVSMKDTDWYSKAWSKHSISKSKSAYRAERTNERFEVED